MKRLIAYWQGLITSLECVHSSIPMFKVAKHAKGTKLLDISLMAYFNRYQSQMHLGNRYQWILSSSYRILRDSTRFSSLSTDLPRWHILSRLPSKVSMHRTSHRYIHRISFD